MNGISNGIAWAERGEAGRPMILLIRPLGGSMELWGEFADALAQTLRVLVFDAAGTGRSPGKARTSTAALAEDARGLLDARGIASAHVFGLSLGGMVATRLAIAAPSRVKALVLASTSARGLAFEHAGLRRGLRFARCLTHDGAELERCLVRRVLSRYFHQQHPHDVERFATLAAHSPTPRASILAHVLAAARHDARQEIAAIRASTLILAGNRDHLLGADAGLGLARGIGGATRAVIDDAGHDLTLEQPQQTAARVLAFITNQMVEQ